MDAIVDLAARATSFITLIQDVFVAGHDERERPGKIQLGDIFCELFSARINTHLDNAIHLDLAQQRSVCETAAASNSSPKGRQKMPPAKLIPTFDRKAIELIWISSGIPDPMVARRYTKGIMLRLAAWISSHEDRLFKQLKSTASLPTPYHWREAISNLLYEFPAERVALARALQYLPMQVVLALGGGSYEVKGQRMLQLWATDPIDREVLLSSSEKAYYEKVLMQLEHYRDQTIESVLMSCKALTDRLRQDVPLPFELVFNAELEEIRSSRKMRARERHLVNAVQRKAEPKRTAAELAASESENPASAAKAMQLYALALSGGGIRSATFNLGILQGLAREGLIGQFDYLSTVSGGGYIGSWLTAWIQREGSVSKVSDRLSPEKSSDPFAEEVRPIRWLRMFSNYFTPNASIMSVDAWTVGITWLRNTLLNQLIIALLLLSGLLAIRLLYELWVCAGVWSGGYSGNIAYTLSILFLLGVALMAGLGMRAYHVGQQTGIPLERSSLAWLSKIIAAVIFLGAFIISASFYWTSVGRLQALKHDPGEYLRALWPAAITIFIALSIIAWLGKYERCIISYGRGALFAWTNIVVTGVISACFATAALALGWELMQFIQFKAVQNEWAIGSQQWLPGLYEGIGFIVGMPVILIVFGVTVVVRMALLGRYFPDERREWWGRMGAVMTRAAFIFILLAGSSLLGTKLAHYVLSNPNAGWELPATVGGWVALVGSTVKAAFSGKTSGKGSADAKDPIMLSLLSKAGPYLFAIGLLIFLPAMLIPLYKNNLFHIPCIEENKVVKTIALLLITFIPSFLLAQRVGVNEFSMHHFYRNRLVRAYLGATRRNSDRMKTANPFTNFDMKDDVKLSVLTTKAGYFGPYPILNTALNASSVSSLDRQDRKAESFTFSPLYCGFDFSMTRASADVQQKSYDYGYRPTESFAYARGEGGPGIGTAMAISGAAVNPNQGYHSSSATAFLLTVFNVQMGWWIGNPRKSKWKRADPDQGLGYMIANLTGNTSTRQNFVCLSDGGHFDNMGLYELVRRRCSFIVLGDGEQDDQFTCEGLANAIRRCRIDFGAEIDIDVAPIRDRSADRLSKAQYALGCIRYAGDETPSGVILYLKSSIKSEKPVDVREYSLKNQTFPHQTTADQFFDEAQFESYRQLGLQVAYVAFRDPQVVARLGLQPLVKSAAPPDPNQTDLFVDNQSIWSRIKRWFR